MSDHQQTLRFGTFHTPVASPADGPVRLALLSEQLGYDLVTFQDQPLPGGFQDTWTFLTWVAARTEWIHVSGNVLNLPLRPPAVLARSAASLDPLSGGRFSLALGAGAFWEAIAEMGGRRLTPGQSVDALEEAIDVVRALWDTSARPPLRAGGEWYDVRGARPGPAPAHPVRIWVGAHRPRMLRLVGAKADGWLPSLDALGADGLRGANAIIDRAARAAGRDRPRRGDADAEHPSRTGRRAADPDGGAGRRQRLRARQRRPARARVIRPRGRARRPPRGRLHPCRLTPATHEPAPVGPEDPDHPRTPTTEKDDHPWTP